MKLKIKILSIILFSVLLGSFAQIFLKIGTKDFEFLAIGILLYALSTILYFYALSKEELSWCYSFVGLSYVIVNLLSILLGENFSILKLVGSLAITIGVIFVALN
jgi:uncharacterized membrane protein